MGPFANAKLRCEVVERGYGDGHGPRDDELLAVNPASSSSSFSSSSCSFSSFALPWSKCPAQRKISLQDSGRKIWNLNYCCCRILHITTYRRDSFFDVKPKSRLPRGAFQMNGNVKGVKVLVRHQRTMIIEIQSTPKKDYIGSTKT